MGNPPSPWPLHVPSRYESGAIAGCTANDSVAPSMFFSTKLTIQALLFSFSFVFALRPTAASTKFNRHHLIFLFLPYIKIIFDVTKDHLIIKVSKAAFNLSDKKTCVSGSIKHFLIGPARGVNILVLEWRIHINIFFKT